MKLFLKRDSIKVALVFFFFTSLFAFIYLRIDRAISIDDPFFHIKFAEILRERGMNAFNDFKWIYFSNISQNEGYLVYYNFLFYLVLVPFTFLNPLFLGLKVFSILSASLFLSSIYFLFLKLKIRGAFLWVVIIFSLVNYSFAVKLLMVRPYVFAPLMLIGISYLFYKEKYLWAGIFSSIYFFWHPATFFLPIFMAVIYFLFNGLHKKNELRWKIFLYPIFFIGISIIGLELFFPGFFHYSKNIIFPVVNDVVMDNKIELSKGREVYPLDFFSYFAENKVLISAFFIALFLEIGYFLKTRKDNIKYGVDKLILREVFVFATAVFFVGLFFTGRFEHFFVPFAAFSIALSFNFFFKKIELNKVSSKYLHVGFFIIIIYAFVLNCSLLNDRISSGYYHIYMRDVALSLDKDSKDGEIIFISNWSWFPLLFHYNSNNYYIMGLEPRFLYDYNEELYWLWQNIASFGYVCDKSECTDLRDESGRYLRLDDDDERKKEWYNKNGKQIALTIREKFNSRFIIVSANENKIFYNLIKNSDSFEMTYDGSFKDGTYVYKIKE